MIPQVAALIVGTILLLTGLALAWPPLALIVAGLELVAWALLSDRKAAHETA